MKAGNQYSKNQHILGPIYCCRCDWRQDHSSQSSWEGSMSAVSDCTSLGSSLTPSNWASCVHNINNHINNHRQTRAINPPERSTGALLISLWAPCPYWEICSSLTRTFTTKRHNATSNFTLKSQKMNAHLENRFCRLDAGTAKGIHPLFFRSQTIQNPGDTD